MISTVDAEAARGFHQACRSASVTSAAGLQALWGAVTQRLDGHAAPQFGLTIAGRPAELPGIESALGMFMNTLPVAWQAEGRDSVRHWLSTAAGNALDLIDNGMIPQSQLNRMAGISDGEALYDSYLIYQNAPSADTGEETGDFDLVDEPTGGYSQQEHRLRLDVFPADTGRLHMSLSGYEPQHRLREYLGLLTGGVLTMDASVIDKPMSTILDAGPALPPVVATDSLVEAMVRDTPFEVLKGEAGE
ncbi:MAG: condensation domain-containing protein, partial [Stackebrandtia sp.]